VSGQHGRADTPGIPRQHQRSAPRRQAIENPNTADELHPIDHQMQKVRPRRQHRRGGHLGTERPAKCFTCGYEPPRGEQWFDVISSGWHAKGSKLAFFCTRAVAITRIATSPSQCFHFRGATLESGAYGSAEVEGRTLIRPITKQRCIETIVPRLNRGVFCAALGVSLLPVAL
jgi:hypothetical protein